MKKLLAIALILALVFCVSCTAKETAGDTDDRSGETDSSENTDINVIPDGQPDETPDDKEENNADETAGFTVALSDGRTVVLGSGADEAVAGLGEYTDVFEAPSCIHEGFDRVYTYGGFSLTTSPDGNGAEYAAEFVLETAECALENGLTIGSTVEDMTAAYGEDYTDSFGFITYELDGASAAFVTDGGIITSIVFTYSK